MTVWCGNMVLKLVGLPRPSVTQLGTLLASEMTFLQNNEKFLVSMLLFQIVIPCGIKNKKILDACREEP